LLLHISMLSNIKSGYCIRVAALLRGVFYTSRQLGVYTFFKGRHLPCLLFHCAARNACLTDAVIYNKSMARS